MPQTWLQKLEEQLNVDVDVSENQSVSSKGGAFAKLWVCYSGWTQHIPKTSKSRPMT